MNGVQRKDRGGGEGQPLIVEEPLGEPEQHADDKSVQQQIRQVESVGEQAE